MRCGGGVGSHRSLQRVLLLQWLYAGRCYSAGGDKADGAPADHDAADDELPHRAASAWRAWHALSVFLTDTGSALVHEPAPETDAVAEFAPDAVYLLTGANI